MFLYYVPNVNRETLQANLPQVLAEHGLDVAHRDLAGPQHARERARISACTIMRGGPDVEGMGGSGVLFAVRSGPLAQLPDAPQLGHVRLEPEHQRFTRCASPGRKPYWLGVDDRFPIVAEDLLRDSARKGYDRPLGDGNVWHVPTIRRPGGMPALPSTWGLTETGSFQQTTLPEYDWAWDLAEKIWLTFTYQDDITIEEGFHRAALVLSLNYRVGPFECSRLKLLNSETYGLVTKAAVAGDLIEELISLRGPETGDEDAKKKPGADACLSAGPGAPDGTPATAPLTETSTSCAEASAAKTLSP